MSERHDDAAHLRQPPAASSGGYKVNKRGGKRGRRAKRAAAGRAATADQETPRAPEGATEEREGRALRDRSPTPHPRASALRLRSRDPSRENDSRDESSRRAVLRPGPGDQEQSGDLEDDALESDENEAEWRRSRERRCPRMWRSPAGRRRPQGAAEGPRPGKGGGARRPFFARKGAPKGGRHGDGGKQK